MVWKCCVSNCRSGYAPIGSRASSSVPAAANERVSMYSFPKGGEVRAKWIRAIKRKEFTPGASHRVCKLHFTAEDFMTVSTDSNTTRAAKRPKLLKKQTLKPSAVPSLFPNYPIYLSKSTPTARSHKTSAGARRDLDNSRLLNLENDFFRSGLISSLENVKQKLSSTKLPVDIEYISKEDRRLVDALDTSALNRIEDIAQEESNVIFYVAGYIGRSISRANKCESCKTLLLENKEIDVQRGSETKNPALRQLLELADRGGLAAPTELTYFTCAFAYVVFSQTMASCDIGKQFLSCKIHNAIFVTTVACVIGTRYSDTGMTSIASTSCDNSQLLFERILYQMFNCFMKNVLKNLNAASFSAHTCVASPKCCNSSRKMKTLTGFGSCVK